MYPASFAYAAPRSLDEALDLLEQHGEDAKLLAGGHSLIPAMKLRLIEPSVLVDLGRVPGLSGVREEDGALVIGAMTVHADVAASELVRRRIPGLAGAAAGIGDLQVRNRGTIGGSVAHFDPAADFPVALTAFDASFTLTSRSGSRILAAEDFFVDFFTTALEPGEILTEVRVPVPADGAATGYAKFPHPASGYVVVSAGALVQRDAAGRCAAARIALGGLGGRPLRAAALEEALRGEELTPRAIATAAALAGEGAEPEGDAYASADYRRRVARVYACRAIEAALQGVTR